MEKNENKVENATIINNVVLTDDCLKYLRMLQEEDNAIIREIRENISDTCMLLIKAIEYVDKKFSCEAIESITELNRTRDNLKLLMKP